jgi:hypothetical protein
MAGFADLQARHPDAVQVRRLGMSRAGRPIDMYSIGSGRLSHLVVGGVHPNEPIGSWTALHLAEQLLCDQDLHDGLDARWNIIPCVDPDGYKLNEGWLANPHDRGHYARHFFRPSGNEQVEWTFPFHYKKASFDAMLPETRALRDGIDGVGPDLYVALHNSEMGGVYYYLSREEPALYPMLHEIPRQLGIPLNEGEPEAGFLKAYAPAIFADGTLEDAYDWAEALGIEPHPPGSGGDSSGSYARRNHGSLCLIAELPYWRTSQVSDTSVVEETYAAVLARTGQQMADLTEVLQTAASGGAEVMDWTGQLARNALVFVGMMHGAAQTTLARAAQSEANRPATAAERFGCEDTVRMFRLRYGGMMLRALESAPNPCPALQAVTARMSDQYEQWQVEAAAADQSEPIAIEALVGVQYGATLAAASHLAGRLV